MGQVLQPFDHFCRPPLAFPQSVCIFPELWGPELDTVPHVRCDSWVVWGGRVSLLAMPLQMQPGIQFAFVAAAACC